MPGSPSVQTLQLAGAALGLFFFFALGAIVGSFINVLVYRLPRGINVVTPPSRCPACGTRLRFTQNFPIFGWLWLRGKCRFCKSPISAEYPVIELIVALLFALLYAMWFMTPSLFELAGVNVAALRPEWAADGLARTWPMFAAVLVLVASLVAMTLIDARTFTIPLVLPWVAAATALVAHPLHALWLGATRGGLARSPHAWTIPTYGWDVTIGALGAGLGVVVACAMLAMRLLPRSFADYEEWEKKAVEIEQAAAATAKSRAKAAPPAKSALGPAIFRTILFTGPAVALMLLGFSMGLRVDRPFHGMLFGLALGLLIGLILRRLAPDGDDSEQPLWVQYPHARREMLKEILFLAPCLAIGLAGWAFGARLTGEPPLWLAALGGSLLGLIVGGGLVWAVRIFGSLVFGKEAMGLGDVHLMAAVGATLGWMDPSIAFFVAPFFGIAAAMLSAVMAGVFKRAGTALPYGPSLALATLLIIYAKPLFEAFLSMLLGAPVDLP